MHSKKPAALVAASLVAAITIAACAVKQVSSGNLEQGVRFPADPRTPDPEQK